MQIITQVPINLAPEEILKAQFLGRRTSFSPSLLRSAADAIAAGRGLFAPAAVYDEFPVLGIEGEELLIGANGATARLRIGPKIDLLEPAERVLIAVNTIGPALETRVDELHREREPLEAYMLDSVGVVGLGAVGEAMRATVERRAAELGWGVGAALAPGSLVGWPLRGQRELCALLPLDEIGVVLSDSYVLVPHKSASVLVGLGPRYTASRVGSVCRFCSLSDSCWRRRKDRDDDCPGD
jgi:hypothetical protein